MKQLSTGQDSTLENYRLLSAIVFGEDSAAVKYLDTRIEAASVDEEVLTEESEMLRFLSNLNEKG